MERFKAIDEYFEFLLEIGGMTLPEEIIPSDMYDLNRSSLHAGIGCWKTIESTISTAEIEELETFYRHDLPKSFKRFLKYKFYVDVDFGEWGLRFFDLKPDERLQHWMDEIDSLYPETIIHNYLAFGECNEGNSVVCLNANVKSDVGEYEIGIFDTIEMEYEAIATNFDELLLKIHNWLNEWKVNRKKGDIS